MSDYLAAFYAGSTEPWAVSVLQALVRLRRPRRILELGTFEGRTTQALVEARFGSEVVTVDSSRRWETLPVEAEFVEMDAIGYLEELLPRAFDFVFVDDDHERSHVEHEVDLLLDGIVSEGGLVVLHDVVGPFGLDEVVLERGGFIVELPLLHAAGGLGVIEV